MPAPKITIYTKISCPYCIRALALLNSKNVEIENIEAAENHLARQEMRERSGRNTFPQIFINNKHIGGCDDLVALDNAGGLDPLLIS